MELNISKEKYLEILRDMLSKKGGTSMQVSYNGFTGELVKLERSLCNPKAYDLSIYDRENRVMHSFDCINPKDLKFLGGAVMFGG